jgi:3-phenylpropionate/trans-cinnamate dioxygenase ferredoxin reductase subunit
MPEQLIVVVGAGQAGGNVVISLRDEGYDGDIVLLGDEPGVPFGRPPLSKTYLREEEDLSGWLVKPDEWYEQHAVSVRPRARAERIDAAGARVVLQDGENIDCDSVCIATGCRPRSIRAEGADLDGVFVLRTKADADAIKAAARAPGAKCVVVGMSFIGAEVAASLRQRGVDVTAILPGSGPLASVLGDEVAAVMADVHRDHGVELVANETVSSFRGHGRVEAVVTESGRSFGCTFCVVGVGVQPNAEIAERSGIAVDNGVLVDAACRTNVNGVFAVGDVANHDHPLFGRLRVEHYNNAEKQGRHVGRAMLGKRGDYSYVHSFWSDQYEDKIEYIGYAKEWDEFVVRGDLDSRAFLGFYLKDGRILAAMGLNRGGDPEAEPDSELAGAGRLISSRAAVDAKILARDGSEIGDAAR